MGICLHLFGINIAIFLFATDNMLDSITGIKFVILKISK